MKIFHHKRFALYVYNYILGPMPFEYCANIGEWTLLIISQALKFFLIANKATKEEIKQATQLLSVIGKFTYFQLHTIHWKNRMTNVM